MNVLVLITVPNLGWKVACALAHAHNNVYVAAPATFSFFKYTGWCKKFFPLKSLVWEEGDISIKVISELESIIEEANIENIVPADFDCFKLVSKFKTSFFESFNFPIIEYDQLLQLHDKKEFSNLLNTLEIPQPRTIDLKSADRQMDMTFPAVTKPLNSSDGQGIEGHDNWDQVEQWKDTTPDLNNYILQELVKGVDIGLSFIAQHGQILKATSFIHNKRFSRTFFTDPLLVEMGQKIVKHTNYNGVGHFDLMKSHDDDSYRFLELNPRFGGSLLYSMHAGANYPDLAVKMNDPNLLTEKKTISGTTHLSVKQYLFGAFCSRQHYY